MDVRELKGKRLLLVGAAGPGGRLMSVSAVNWGSLLVCTRSSRAGVFFFTENEQKCLAGGCWLASLVAGHLLLPFPKAPL